jgi:tRNA(Ile2) C34 agmatinyltransferase TiaS
VTEPLIVFVRPRCPGCGAERLRNQGSKKRGVVRYYRCRACGKRFPAYRREQHEVRGRFCDESPQRRNLQPGESSAAGPQSPE